jgi:hypothetical protein
MHSATGRLTLDIVFNSPLELERVKLHIHPGGTRSNRGGAITGIFRVDKVSAFGSDNIGVLPVSGCSHRTHLKRDLRRRPGRSGGQLSHQTEKGGGELTETDRVALA